ncbi:MAG: hypothetical protein ABSH51_24110 [Solirubrobacteraceae bacterium]
MFVNVETPRFREPIDVFIVMLAGCTLSTVFNALAGSRRAPAAPTAAAAPARPPATASRTA